jgi:hypothetical protein
MVFVMLLIALPGFLVTIRATPIPPDAPPTLDHVLAAVRGVTPPAAHVLVAGGRPALVFYRATYLLYPRTVTTAFPTDYAHRGTAPPISWRDLERRARRQGARYILLWALPVAPASAVRMRLSAGTMVEVRP